MNAPLASRRRRPIVRAAATLHKWLALVIGLQILIWFATGLFMSFVPIGQVRGEFLKAEGPPALLDVPTLAAPLAARLAALPAPPAAIEVRPLLGRPTLLVRPADGQPILIDVESGGLLSPLPAPLAMAIARADHAEGARPTGARWVTAESPEYRGPLPAWRVQFDDAHGSALYVAAHEGRVTSRRTDLWRLYDFLWGLHIMDWAEHEKINHWWLWGSAALALIVALSGVVMLPRALGRSGRHRRDVGEP